MIATVQNALDAARAALGDTNGQIFTNAVLFPHFNRANRTVIRAIGSLGSLRFQRETYYVLPANQSFLLPASFGVSDFLEPRMLEQRSSLTSYTVTGASQITGAIRLTTSTAHTLQTGNMVTCQGVAGMQGTDGIWGISVPDNTHIDLLGAVATGAYSSGGTVVYSLSAFYPMDRTEWIHQFTPQGQTPVVWQWSDNALRFVPSTTDTQLRIAYWASGPDLASTGTSLWADDILDIVAVLTAAYAAESRGATDKSQSLLQQALGPDMDIYDPDGMLLQTIQIAVRQMQAVPPVERQRVGFRSPLTSSPLGWQ